MSTSGKRTVITSRNGKQFALLDRVMEEVRHTGRYKSPHSAYWARRSEIRNIFADGVRCGNIEYFIGSPDPESENAYYRVFENRNQVAIGCCDFVGENAIKLQEWAIGKTNKNEENGKMITVKNDCEEKFTLGATEMRQLPNGYKMQRKDLKAAIASYKSGRYMEVQYGFTDGYDVRMGAFEDDGNNSITIGCCNFYNNEAHKLRKWAMGGKNGSTGTRKRTGTAKNSKRKTAPRTARSASAARSHKAGSRKKAVAAGANRRRTTAR